MGARRRSELPEQPGRARWNRVSQGHPGRNRQRRARPIRDGLHPLQPERRFDAKPRSGADAARHADRPARLFVGYRGELVQRGADRDRAAPRDSGILRLGYLAVRERAERHPSGSLHYVAHRVVLSPEQGLQAADRSHERAPDPLVRLHRRRLRRPAGIRSSAGLYDRHHQYLPVQTLHPGFPGRHPQGRRRVRRHGPLPHDARPQHADAGSGPAPGDRGRLARREGEQRQSHGQYHRRRPRRATGVLHQHERGAVHRAGHQLAAAQRRAAQLRAAAGIPGLAQRQRVRQRYRLAADHELHRTRSDRERQQRGGGRLRGRGDRFRQLPHARGRQFRHPDGFLTMNKRAAALLMSLVMLASGCTDWLDVNSNPNGPQTVASYVYLPPMLHWMVTAPQYDGRFVGRYTQEWTLPGTSLSTWDRMGYDAASDNGAEQWRDVYWSLGQNLIDMNAKAEAEQRWDLLGVGVILKAWGWQVLTDLHGPIIIKEAFDESRTRFDYDPQDFAYSEVQRLLDSAIVLLQRTDGAVDQAYLAKGDNIYKGDRTKWLKFAYGMRALSLNHFTNKSTYDPAAVIADVDRSFSSNSDDALLQYPALST